MLIVWAGLALVGILRAESPPAEPFPLYLDMALPVADTLSNLSRELPPGEHTVQKSFLTTVVVDKSGHVKTIGEIPGDSAVPKMDIEDMLSSVTFSFLSGDIRPWDSAGKTDIEIPVRLDYTRGFGRVQNVAAAFPIRPDTTSVNSLLNKLFLRYGIMAPAIDSMMAINYVLDNTRTSGQYPTITALVKLDENGHLLDIEYPFPEQRNMRHQVHVALMNARFRPAEIQGQGIPCEFLATFRIFDNIAYPFDPLTVDTLPKMETEKRFLAYYLNPKDLGMPPLPRKHAQGYIRGGILARGMMGHANVFVNIDTTGAIADVSIARGIPGHADDLRELVKALNWYPAVDSEGNAVPFWGEIRLHFTGKTKVVYNAEWLR